MQFAQEYAKFGKPPARALPPGRDFLCVLRLRPVMLFYKIFGIYLYIFAIYFFYILCYIVFNGYFSRKYLVAVLFCKSCSERMIDMTFMKKFTSAALTAAMLFTMAMLASALETPKQPYPETTYTIENQGVVYTVTTYYNEDGDYEAVVTGGGEYAKAVNNGEALTVTVEKDGSAETYSSSLDPSAVPQPASITESKAVGGIFLPQG